MIQPLDDKTLRRLARPFERGEGGGFFFCPFLSAAIAGRKKTSMRLIMKTALDEGISSRMIDEIILQTHLFLGFPAMIEASRMFADIHRPRHNKNQLPGPYSPQDCHEWNKSGTQKIKRIYGPAFDRLVPYINSFSPQILTWMINDGYGQVLSRPGVSFPLRELSVVATLTVTAYTNQLKAHIRGALNTGVKQKVINRTMDNCRFFCSEVKIEKAREILAGATAA
jgi:4-carboxymuconolactone decarboxylase